ncbi:MAG: hypothetical protein ACK4RK_14495 [Gemmataceae bacterium]
MSRAYRIQVRESLRRVLRGSDRVSTQLELLDILPCEQMAELLHQELIRRGFQEKDNELIRQQDGITVRLDPQSGTIAVEVETKETVQLESQREGHGYDDLGPSARRIQEALRAEAQQDLAAQAEHQRERLQAQAADKLEAFLGDLRQELNQVTNRVTADALKIKAQQLGQIKELTEDPQTGSMTIVLEV